MIRFLNPEFLWLLALLPLPAFNFFDTESKHHEHRH